MRTRPHEDRLKHAMQPDARRELMKSVLIKGRTRIGEQLGFVNVGDGQLLKRACWDERWMDEQTAKINTTLSDMPTLVGTAKRRA